MEQAQTITSIFPLAEIFAKRAESVEEPKEETKQDKLDAKYEKIREKLVLNALGLTKKTFDVLKQASKESDERYVNPTEADDTLIKYYVAKEANRSLKSTIKSAVLTVVSLAITVLGFVAAGPLAGITMLPAVLKVVGLFGTIFGAIRTVKGAIKARRGMKADWIAKDQDFNKEFKNLLAKHDKYMAKVDEDKELIKEEMSKGKKSFKKFMKSYSEGLKEEMQKPEIEQKDDSTQMSC